MSDSPTASNRWSEDLAAFDDPLVHRLRDSGDVWDLPEGQLLLPQAFGFCRGVQRALAILQREVAEPRTRGRLVLLGEIIHNPWVNDFFRRRGVRVLSRAELSDLEDHVRPADCAVIPAFGVPLEVQRRLAEIECEVIDTSCGDVRRLWVWAERAVEQGYGVVIFGRARHDETVVTKSRLAAAGGKYLVLGDLGEVDLFCRLVAAAAPEGAFREHFGPEATNADGVAPLHRLAQVSQTTMLYEETMEVRRRIREAFVRRFGDDETDGRLLFEPTVCRATQDRQNAAIELCRSRPDLVVVVGGFGSSNTRHLFELARDYAPAWFIEDVAGILSEHRIRTFDPQTEGARVAADWLPERRPLRIGVLAGASCPEAVVGQVLHKLAGFLGGE